MPPRRGLGARLIHSSPFTIHHSSFLILLILLIPALQPLLRSDFTCGYDNTFHLWRAVQVEHLWQQGVFFSRWAPDMALGFGFPLYMFMPMGSAYVVAALYRLGLAWPIALNATFVLSIVLSAVFTFYLVRELFGPYAGVLAGIAYAYAPFRAYDVFYRGGLSESFAWIFPPLVLWALQRWMRGGGRPAASATETPARSSLFLVIGALAWAAFLVTHHLFAFLFAPLFALWGLALACLARDRRAALARLGRGALLGALGLGLAAFFWLPSLMERQWVQLGRSLGTWVFQYHQNFISLAHLFALPRNADPALINDWPEKALGLLPASLVLLALVRWRAFSRRQRWLALVLLGSASAFAFLTLAPSRWFWDHVPLLPYVQFPWRYLGPATFCVAVLIGALVASPGVGRGPRFAVGRGRSRDVGRGRCRDVGRGLRPKSPPRSTDGPSASFGERRQDFPSVGRGLRPKSPVAVFLILVLIVGNLGWFYPRHCPPPSGAFSPDGLGPHDMIAWERATDTLGTTASAEFLPVWVERMPDVSLDADYATGGPVVRLRQEDLPEGANVVRASYGALRATIELDTPVAFQARYLAFYYPGWRVTVDGTPVDVSPTPGTGLVTFPVPAGRHTIAVRFTETPPRLAADALSLLSLLFLAVIIVVGKSSDFWRLAWDKFCAMYKRVPRFWTEKSDRSKARRQGDLRQISLERWARSPTEAPDPRQTSLERWARSPTEAPDPRQTSTERWARSPTEAPDPRQTSTERWARSPTEAPLWPLAIAVAFVALKALLLDRLPMPWHHTNLRPDGTLQGVPVPLNVNFDGRARLLGMDPPPDTFAADAAPPVRFYAQALDHAGRDWRLGLTLLDPDGMRWMPDSLRAPRATRAPPPMPEWSAFNAARSGSSDPDRLTPATYALWAYHLDVLPGAPPGSYTLAVSLFDRDTLAPASVLGPDGNPQGPSLALRTLQLERPSRPPTLVELGVLDEDSPGMSDEVDAGELDEVSDRSPRLGQETFGEREGETFGERGWELDEVSDGSPRLGQETFGEREGELDEVSDRSSRLGQETFGEREGELDEVSDGSPRLGQETFGEREGETFGEREGELDEVSDRSPTLHRCGALGLWAMTADRTVAAPGDPVGLRWVWEALDTPSEILTMTVTLRDAEGKVAHTWHLPPVATWWPTDRWRAGDRWVGRHVLRLPGGLTSLDEVSDRQPQLVTSLPGCADLASVNLEIDAPERLWQVPASLQPRDVTLGDLGGDLVRLAGVAVTPQALAPGEMVRVTLAWQALAEMTTSYRVFMHVLGPDGLSPIVAQHDGEPVNWTRPTTGWAVGEVVVETREVQMPGDAAPGTYTLQVGLYLPEGGRLHTEDGDDAVQVGALEVN
jgi:hypothetical protein